MGEQRSALLAGAAGSVLEIGGGTGANLPHYRNVEDVTIAEPDPYMRQRLRRKLGEERFPVEVTEAGAEALPFGDDSFDGVVSTLVLCTVPDQGRALAEIIRVLKPGGRLLFVEHVRGEGTNARVQDVILPVWRRVFAGCHPNRDTVGRMRDAGFEIRSLHHFEPPGPYGGLMPHVRGEAVAP